MEELNNYLRKQGFDENVVSAVNQISNVLKTIKKDRQELIDRCMLEKSSTEKVA